MRLKNSTTEETSGVYQLKKMIKLQHNCNTQNQNIMVQ